MIQVSEAEFIRNERERLDGLAQIIRECGITVYEIAHGSRVKYDTILRALRKQPIRSETEARIRHYIKIKQDAEAKNQSECC